MRTLRLALSLAASASLAALSASQNGNGSKPFAVMVGDPAPKLNVSKWVKGEPVKEFEKGKVYVVEFWATWCGPCRATIPHLTELQKKYADKAQFVGVSIWESDQKNVEPFVTQMGPKMDYTVAMDTVASGDERGRNGAMAAGWMKAAGQNGIPTAFIIDREGSVAWIGHPMEIEEPLSKVVAGTWDTKAFAEKHRDAMEKEAKSAAFRARLGEAAKAEDWNKFVSICDEMLAAGLPDGGMNKFFVLTNKLKEYDKASAVGRDLVQGPLKDNWNALNSLAWAIVDPNGKMEKRDLDLALMAAERSVELDRNYANVDTLARVWFMKGDKAKAITLQKEAISLAKDENSKAELEKALKEYEGA